MDFYRVLGVARDASQQEIKDAWRREALKNHPDRFTSQAWAWRGLEEAGSLESVRPWNMHSSMKPCMQAPGRIRE